MSAPSKCISVTEAKDLQDNWVASRAVDIELAQGFVDAREFLFSLADLQEFLDYVKEQSEEEGILNPGVRIYFGAYDNATSDKATVFLAPTKNVTSMGVVANNYNLKPLNSGLSGFPPTNY